jgi:hypothetical protein
VVNRRRQRGSDGLAENNRRGAEIERERERLSALLSGDELA